MVVLCTVYDQDGKQQYRGEDFKEAERFAKKLLGTAHIKMYHAVGDQQVAVNDYTFVNGEERVHDLRYVQRSEIEIMFEVLTRG